MKSFWLQVVVRWHALLVWAGIRKLSFRDKLPPEARVHYDEIIKFFQPSKGVPTPVKEAKPAPMFERAHCRSNLWTAEIGGIAPFLVAELSPPSMIRSYDAELGRQIVSFSPVHLTFYDIVGDSTMVRLASLVNNSLTDLTVKIVDNLGTIIEVWKMTVLPIAVHPLTILDYSRAEPIKWQLECECSKWEIQVVDENQNAGTVN